MSKNTNDGGPAFPQTDDSWKGRNMNPPVPSGMSLRDWFAGQALAGEMATYLESSASDHAAAIAKRCYTLADAMLEARNVTSK